MTKKSDKDIQSEMITALEKIAKPLGVAIGELWAVFVRQYVVKGITEAFTGMTVLAFSIYLHSVIGQWALIVSAVSLVFFYGAIQLIGNPKYHAINDIIKRVKDLR